MNTKRIGALAGAVALLGLVASSVPGYLVSQWVDGGAQSGVVPTFGTVGVTVSVYTSVVGMVEVGVPVLLGVALGYRLARRLGDDDLNRALGAVAAGSVAALLLAATVPLAGVWSVGGGVTGVSGLLLYVFVVLQHLVGVSLLVTVGAAAGVALERFDLFDRGDARSPTAGTGSESAEPSDTVSPDGERGTRPTR